jgi:hypothetical protein
LLVGSKLLPGHLHAGTELKDKTRKIYKCNGLLLLVVLLITFFTGAHFNLWKATVFADYSVTLAVLYLLLCVALATWLYISGSKHPDPNLVHPLSDSAGTLRLHTINTQTLFQIVSQFGTGPWA